MSIIFAQPRHEYHSYRDFWQLVRLCNYPLIYIDEINPHDLDNVYIFSGPDASNEFVGATARIIYWLLEWYGDYHQRPGISETWVSNRTYADMIGARFVPCGSHQNLGARPKHRRIKYDVAHMSYDGIHRRSLLLGKLKSAGIRITPNAWGDERHNSLIETFFMMHIHQSAEYPAIAPLRASLAAAYGLVFIAENGWSIEPYNDTILTAHYDELFDLLLRARKNAMINDKARGFFYKLCDELRFDKVIEAHV